MPELQPYTPPNFAANLTAMQAAKSQGEAGKLNAAVDMGKLDLDFQKLGLEKQKFASEQQKAVTKEKSEALDYFLNVTAGVNSEEDLAIAKSILNSKYPEHAPGLEKLLPTYSPKSVRMVRESIRTETQRLKMEEQQSELKGFAPGSAIYQDGKLVDTVPTKPDKPDYELFTDDKGQQAYLTKGASVPSGWKKVEKAGGGVTINMPKAAPSGERESLNKLFEFDSQLERIEKSYDPKYVGRVQGVVGAVKELTGVKADKKESEFRQVTRDISDTLLRLRSGAQINEQEYQRMLKLVPTANLPEQVFEARLKSLRTAIKDSISIRRGTMEDSGFVAPSGGKSAGGVTVLKFDSEGNMVE